MEKYFLSAQCSQHTNHKALNVTTIALAIAILWVIAHSYPMMYPGYDIWWHLGVMQTGAAYDPSMATYARWHRLWDSILDFFSIQDIFSRALVIHRAQFLLTVCLIGSASFLCLLSVFRNAGSNSYYLFASIISICIWLAMHGTHSAAHFGGEDSAITQSWIMWYSVNYQISLPMYFLASAGSLAVISGAITKRYRKQIVTLTALALAGVIFCHLAELPYYIFNAIFLALIFGKLREIVLFLISFLLFLLLLLYALPYISHRIPELPNLVIEGNFSELWRQIIDRGSAIAIHGGNRAATSWNTLYTSSLIAISVSIMVSLKHKAIPDIQRTPMLFLMLTASTPAMLYNQFSAGTLALITNQDIAWRFSFSSLLYLGLPILGTLFIIQLRSSKHSKWTYLTGASLILLTMLSFESKPVRSNIESIARSLSPSEIHYGLSKDHQKALMDISTAIDGEVSRGPFCLDIFSTYYLYYAFSQTNICLPTTISSLPGTIAPESSTTKCLCTFERKQNATMVNNLKLPAWDFRFISE